MELGFKGVRESGKPGLWIQGFEHVYSELSSGCWVCILAFRSVRAVKAVWVNESGFRTFWEDVKGS